MAWTPFSAEAIMLETELRRLGPSRISDRIEVIKQALEKAHRHGPSDMSYGEFEKMLEDRI